MPNKDEIEKLEQQKKAELEAEAKAKAEAELKAKLELEAAEKQKADEEAKKKAEEEAKAKAEEEAKKLAEQGKDQAPAEQEPQGRPITDFVLKEDLEKMFNPLSDKINALIGETTKLQQEKAQLEADKKKVEEEKAQLEEEKKKAELEAQQLKDKFVNQSFGTMGRGGIVDPSAKSTTYESFDEYNMRILGHK